MQLLKHNHISLHIIIITIFGLREIPGGRIHQAPAHANSMCSKHAWLGKFSNKEHTDLSDSFHYSTAIFRVKTWFLSFLAIPAVETTTPMVVRFKHFSSHVSSENQVLCFIFNVQFVASICFRKHTQSLYTNNCFIIQIYYIMIVQHHDILSWWSQYITCNVNYPNIYSIWLTAAWKWFWDLVEKLLT